MPVHSPSDKPMDKEWEGVNKNGLFTKKFEQKTTIVSPPLFSSLTVLFYDLYVYTIAVFLNETKQ